MKKIVIILVLLLLSKLANAQFLYGHEWIKFDQEYYKIETKADGLYRVNGSNFSLFVGKDPEYLQLFFRGKEVAIKVSSSGNTFNNSDFIEFFGKMNDGALDSLIYPTPNIHTNEYRNIHSDTCAFFLTFGTEKGKRMQTINHLSANYTAPSYLVKERLSVGTDWYWGRNESNNTIIEAEYSYSEGFCHGLILTTDAIGWGVPERVITLDKINNIHSTNSSINIQAKLTNSIETSHNIEILVSNDSSTFRSIGTILMNGLGNSIFSSYIGPNDVSSDGKTYIKFKALSGSRVTIPWVKATYNTTYNNTNYHDLYFSNIFNSNIDIIDSDNIHTPYDFTSFYNIAPIAYNANNNNLNFKIPNTVKKFLLYNNSKILNPHKISRAHFREIDPLNSNYLIISHRQLMRANAASSNPVNDYAAYRASINGGNYDTLTLEIGQIVNQYNYGEYSPLAIKKLANYLADNNPNYQHIFLIGHGIWYEHYRFNSNNTHKELVPTWGAPPSDQLLTTGFNTNYVPRISVGRLSVRNPQQITDYLNKVIEHETTSPIAPWKKNVLHLGGGNNKEFKPNLDIWAEIIKGPLMGASVSEIHKNAIGTTQVIPIPDQINNGIGLVNFLGHASLEFSDIHIDFASNDAVGYRNKGKYTHLIVNGCLSGNIYDGTSDRSYILDWVLTPNRGAVTGMGNVYFGYAHNIHRYMLHFYSTAFSDSAFYGKGAGIIQKETTRRVFQQFGNELGMRTQTLQVPLQGDPAISYFKPTMPDYELNSSTMAIEGYNGEKVNALSDSFNIKYVVTNFGKALADSILVSLKRTYANGMSTTVDSVRIKSIYLADTLRFKVKKENIDAYGLNKFEIHVEHVNDIEEYNESNNIGVLEYIMPSRGVTPIFPIEYSIESQKPVSLIAQANDLFIDNTDFYFEIDTSYAFNSPINEKKIITSQSLAIWNNPSIINNFNFLNPNDTVVFYWRVRYNNIPFGSDTIWGNSSFTFIPNSPRGWSQSTFPQFKKAHLTDINRNDNNKKWEFKEIERGIKLYSSGSNIEFNHERAHKIMINNSFIAMICNAWEGLHFCLLNGKTLEVIPNSDTMFLEKCSYNGESNTYYINNLHLNENQNKLGNFLDKIPDNTILIMISQNRIPFSAFGNSLINKFQQKLGSNLIGNLVDGHPFVLMSKIGENGQGFLIGEKTADTTSQISPLDQTIILDTIIKAVGYPRGKIASTVIGPSTEWGSVFHQYKKMGDISTDSFNLKIIGMDMNLNETTLINSVLSDSLAINALISADRFPFLKLEAYKEDLKDDLPPQLKQWQVIYTEAPEGCIDVQTVGKNTYDFKKYDEGETVTYKFAFKNLTNINFKDKLVVKYTLVNNNGRGVKEFWDTLGVLKNNETILFEKKFDTKGIAGTNNITVFVNPRLQPEQYFNNNALQFAFEVNSDNINPMMDVVFDGVRIMDGDIVSPTPHISIVVKDENRYFYKQDLKNIKMLMKYPSADGEGPFREILLENNPQVSFTPASEDNKNELTIEYRPERLQDGVHTLRLQTVDANNNAAGSNDYQITFEVINKSSITNFYPYPNPFSTKCHFVFTLTGNDIPDNFKIQIMTVTGKIVREIMKSEIGPIRIGNNKTSYAWDGTDEYGDKLGNGVYLYKVVMKNDDGNIEHRETAADKTFTKGWGKLYILR
jgi:hypothetical protein